ncbi:hypothetical protein GBF38_015995 [Nibea albiflora]|uniref:Uncharacterized protein n=1 Tax=Nibea albiflora TaxID=240163 RepID=A0ACB7FHR9_NIBAL|nr:hypothetical protein GBF38_015995 [Nibea albiflora]
MIKRRLKMAREECRRREEEMRTPKDKGATAEEEECTTGAADFACSPESSTELQPGLLMTAEKSRAQIH